MKMNLHVGGTHFHVNVFARRLRFNPSIDGFNLKKTPFYSRDFYFWPLSGENLTELSELVLLTSVDR